MRRSLCWLSDFDSYVFVIRRYCCYFVVCASGTAVAVDVEKRDTVALKPPIVVPP
jgi:hypothetical protein